MNCNCLDSFINFQRTIGAWNIDGICRHIGDIRDIHGLFVGHPVAVENGCRDLCCDSNMYRRCCLLRKCSFDFHSECWAHRIQCKFRFPKHQFGCYQSLVMTKQWNHCNGCADGYHLWLSHRNSRNCNVTVKCPRRVWAARNWPRNVNIHRPHSGRNWKMSVASVRWSHSFWSHSNVSLCNFVVFSRCVRTSWVLKFIQIFESVCTEYHIVAGTNFECVRCTVGRRRNNCHSRFARYCRKLWIAGHGKTFR